MSTGVPEDTKIIIGVSEWYDEKSFQDALYISPEPTGKIEYKYKLKEIVLTFSELLDSNRTYVLTIGAGFSDLNRNKMLSSHTLAFSTGFEFDYGVVSGQVFSKKQEGLVVALYPLNEPFLPDSIKGEFFTQTGKNGNFFFSFLPPDVYRLLVFNDLDKNRLYNTGREEVAICWKDIAVDNDTTNNLLLMAKMFPGGCPKVTNISPIHNRALEIMLDRPLEFLPKPEDISITDTVNQDNLEINGVFEHSKDPKRIVLETSVMDSVTYWLIVNGGYDFDGWKMSDSLLFDGIAFADTAPPFFYGLTAESDSFASKVEIFSSEPLQVDLLNQAFFIKIDTSKQYIPLNFSSDKYCVYLSKLNRPIDTDSIFFSANDIKDLSGNTNPDSIIAYPVNLKQNPPEPAKNGSLTGVISYNAASPVVIELVDGKGNVVVSNTVNSPGVFKFNQVPSGFYTLRSYIDKNSNSRFDYGLINPFNFSERFVVSSDSIRIRERWETSGINLEYDANR